MAMFFWRSSVWLIYSYECNITLVMYIVVLWIIVFIIRTLWNTDKIFYYGGFYLYSLLTILALQG